MIAIVYPQFYGVGGIARYLDSFLENLPADAPPVYLITGDENRIERHHKGVEIIHIPSESGRLSLFKWSLAARQVINNLHQQGKIQIVNFHFPPLIPGLFLPTSLPMILTAHTTYLGMSGQFMAEKQFDSPWSPTSILIKKWMEHRIFAHANEVITLTEQGRQEVIRYGYDKKVHVVPNGVDLSRFTPDRSAAKDIDVLFVGRIEIRKGSRPMVELCKTLIQRAPDIRIAIVGYGDDDVFVKQELAPFARNIQLPGKVPFEQVSSYYDRAKLYASTSYYEGLPGTCLEAMAMGLPAVVWDLLFYKGLVVPDENGALVPVNDISGMADTLLELRVQPDLCHQWGQAGRQLLSQRYSWKDLAKQLVDIFCNVAGSKIK